MGRKAKCPDCGSYMEGPTYIKEREVKEPDPNCTTCEKFRKTTVKLNWIALYACPTCKSVKERPMTKEEVKEHARETGWGSTTRKPNFGKSIIEKAEKVVEEEIETEEILKKEEKKETLITPLEDFINKLNNLSEIERVYLKEPRHHASHLKDWKILELHIVPKSRPPYLEFERFCRDYDGVYDGISEMRFLKVGDVYLVRIIESPARLTHV